MSVLGTVRGWLSGRQSKDALVAVPRPGQHIEFDEDEKRAIKYEWPSGLEDLVFKKENAKILDQQFTGGALLKVASRRLANGDLRSAASSCVKAIGVTEGAPEAWLLLAEIHAASGDLGRAASLLEQALDKANKLGIALTDGPPYADRVSALERELLETHG